MQDLAAAACLDGQLQEVQRLLSIDQTLQVCPMILLLLCDEVTVKRICHHTDSSDNRQLHFEIGTCIQHCTCPPGKHAVPCTILQTPCLHVAGPSVQAPGAPGIPGFAPPMPVRTSSTGTPGAAYRPLAPGTGNTPPLHSGVASVFVKTLHVPAAACTTLCQLA